MKITRVLYVCKSGSIETFPVNMNLNIVNKSWKTAHDMNADEVTSILHTAIEFKNATNPKAKRIKIPEFHSKSVTLLLRHSNEMLQASFYSAGGFVKVPVHTIVIPNWDERAHVIDVRKIFDQHTDCLFCESKYISKSQKIVWDSPIPVVFVRSCRSYLILGLAQLMTIYLKYKRLKGLNLLWIGPPCAGLNTLLAFCPKVCINLSYCCGFTASLPASPSCLENIKQQCAQTFNCQECKIENLATTLKKADVILTTKQTDTSLKITKDMFNAAKPQSIILHTLHRGTSDINEEIFQQKNCQVWEMVSNMKWIFAALMVRLMSAYEHTTSPPNFNDQSRNKL